LSTTFFTYCQVFSLDSVFLAGSAVHFPSFAPQILSDLSLFYKRNCLSCNCKLLVCRDHADLHFGIRCGDHCLITVSCIIDFIINSNSKIAKVSSDLSADQIGILTNSCGKCDCIYRSWLPHRNRCILQHGSRILRSH